MVRRSPRIGVTTGRTTVPSVLGGRKDVAQVNSAFLDLVSRAGGLPIVVSADAARGHEEDLATMLDGLVLTSGPDLDPGLWGAATEVRYAADVAGWGQPYRRSLPLRPDELRDRFEIELYRRCRAHGRPVLAVCRGLQLVNVAHGGSLHQELSPESAEAFDHAIRPDGWVNHHRMTILPGTKLHDLIGNADAWTSSLHHQGVDRLGDGLVVSARAPDGVIEALEAAEPPLVLAVQGHMEMTMDTLPEYGALVDELVDAARKDSRP